MSKSYYRLFKKKIKKINMLLSHGVNGYGQYNISIGEGLEPFCDALLRIIRVEYRLYSFSTLRYAGGMLSNSVTWDMVISHKNKHLVLPRVAIRHLKTSIENSR